MILKRIVEFAEKNVSEIPSGYQTRFITKVIQLNSDGSLRAIVPLTVDKRKDQRGKDRFGEVRLEPKETPQRTSNTYAKLLSDDAEYVLGKTADGKSSKKSTERHQAWRDTLQKAYESTSDKEIKAVWQWVETGGPEALRNDPQVTDEDDLTFEVDGVYPTELNSIRAHWAEQTKNSLVKSNGQCLISNNYGPVIDPMPYPIKGIPRGQTSGTALISVNNKAGESYGSGGALNSPTSLDAAEKLCNGLNYLINEGSKVIDDKGKERTKYKYSLRVGPTVYIAWAKGKQEVDFWNILDNPMPEHVQALIESPLTGKGAPNVAEADFFVMSLSANAARIIVRDFHETTLASVKKNIGLWYQRLSLINLDGQPASPVGIYRLAASLYRDANKEMPAHIPADLINSALAHRPLPEYLLGLAVKRNLAMQGPFVLNKAKKKTLSTTRLALIKAALTPDPEDSTLSQLNPEHPNCAYHCGRLLAVLESIQRIAIPGLNATLTDRHYGAACASPASVFGNLLKDATSAHLPKLRKSKPGAYVALDRRLQDVAAAIGADFPATLTLRDQGLFALGYYHQKADDLAAAQKNKELKELAEGETNTEDTTE